MVPDSIQSWLANHPKVLTALFVGGMYLAKASEITGQGGGGTYSGP